MPQSNLDTEPQKQNLISLSEGILIILLTAFCYCVTYLWKLVYFVLLRIPTDLLTVSMDDCLKVGLIIAAMSVMATLLFTGGIDALAEAQGQPGWIAWVNRIFAISCFCMAINHIFKLGWTTYAILLPAYILLKSLGRLKIFRNWKEKDVSKRLTHTPLKIRRPSFSRLLIWLGLNPLKFMLGIMTVVTITAVSAASTVRHMKTFWFVDTAKYAILETYKDYFICKEFDFETEKWRPWVVLMPITDRNYTLSPIIIPEWGFEEDFSNDKRIKYLKSDEKLAR